MRSIQKMSLLFFFFPTKVLILFLVPLTAKLLPNHIITSGQRKKIAVVLHCITTHHALLYQIAFR